MTAAAAAAAVVCALAGCAPTAAKALGHSHTPATPTARATPTAPASSPPASPAPLLPSSGSPAPAAPAAPQAPAPFITPVPAGTVVAQGDVASPKGSIHFHYRMVSNGDDTYSAQYSNFTDTAPIPISVTLLDTPPRVGDGVTYHGVGDHVLGGPTSTAAVPSSTNIGTAPSYLVALVTYSSVASADGVPVELGPGKVLAVTSVHWSVPARQTNVHPVDGGARPLAGGDVTATTASGAPKSYRVGHGDLPADVADRFGITLQDLKWLNPGSGAFDPEGNLYEDAVLNLDPEVL
ncbi:LysM domain-containing protein [Leifsonia sp. C5G2]|uniref:LysM peptidoglycan-binding domain-containing protein n=1 Tax=Leifsonia sp. C5G2 TaxID=2735269 RepID=UPI0015849F11|nr:LysM domain-containing protein [Leifsonia sp. C5G2]NUU08180.1 LysM peptidoglycan-binding domain-containing protein [Leifsonia sp. C5G2]